MKGILAQAGVWVWKNPSIDKTAFSPAMNESLQKNFLHFIGKTFKGDLLILEIYFSIASVQKSCVRTRLASNLIFGSSTDVFQAFAILLFAIFSIQCLKFYYP